MAKGKENGKDPQGQTHLLNSLLHPQDPNGRPWKYLPLVLALGFVARAVVALSGDFVLHPDEIMQYLEPAHQLVFGNGISYWEYFYGAHSWLVPGAVAGVLKLFDLAGLGEPVWYVGGVKLFFCAISLLIPAGMYFFARWHFSETAARVALLAGAFWYELVAFAHKPMTEFVATALLLVAFALCLRQPSEKSSGKGTVLVGIFVVLAVAVRVQYAPLALFPLGAAFLMTRKKIQLVIAATAVFLAVGMFDAITWNGGLFHSYLTNLRFNLTMGQVLMQSPSYQFLLWLLLAGGGLSVVCTAVALANFRRYGFLLASVAVILLLHSLQAQKEYRFIFAAIPLWLLIGSDIVARLMDRASRMRPAAGLVAAGFALVSMTGVLNTLPYQDHVYKVYGMGGIGAGDFVRSRDPIFTAYRYLARAPGVAAIWHVDRFYADLPDYYYLHREIPFYDGVRGRAIFKNLETVSASVTHIVSENPQISLPGYSLERRFGNIRILSRAGSKSEIRKWETYNPIIVGDGLKIIIKHTDPDAPDPPANWGISFAARKQPEP